MEQIKKYIRGNSERGSDVIAELEKLGGVKTHFISGCNEDYLYYIDKNDLIEYTKKGDILYDLLIEHWEEIKLPKQFKDGDVVYVGCECDDFIFIYKGLDKYLRCYISISGEDFFNGDEDRVCRKDRIEKIRLTTEEEKQKLFDAIKENGYRWNAEKKELEKLIEPKFKVGDRIKHRLTGDVYKVLFVLSNGYGGGVYDVAVTNEIGKSIDIKEQDSYELVPNKFDISTLVPFESRVLIRDCKSHKWEPAIWGLKTDDIDYSYIVVGGISYCQCIPYESNEHLLGTTNDCPDFYKTWE